MPHMPRFLPHLLKCPQCRNLLVLPDVETGGDPYHCMKCDFAGPKTAFEGESTTVDDTDTAAADR